jgi:hypothetical protein
MSRSPLALETHFPELAAISDERLRLSVAAIWQHLWEMSEFEELEDVPVSGKIDYPQLRHCQAILRSALVVAPVLEATSGIQLNRDVLIAGALLMDASKLVEQRPGVGGAAEFTDIGRLLPHATYVAHLALAHQVHLDVVHIITSHSPYSSNAPATPEARLLEILDRMDITVLGLSSWGRSMVHSSQPSQAIKPPSAT